MDNNEVCQTLFDADTPANLRTAVNAAFSAIFESAWNFDRHQDLYADRHLVSGLDGLQKDGALKRAFCNGAHVDNLDDPSMQALFNRIMELLASCTNDTPLTVYRGVWVPLDCWDDFIKKAAPATGLPIDSPDLVAALFSNTMKDFNSFSTSRYIAKMYMDGGDDSDQYAVKFLFSGKAYPEDIDYPRTVANNAKDIVAGTSSAAHEIVVTSARRLEDFKIEYTNLDSIPAYHTDKDIKDCYQLAGGNYIRTVLNRETGLYRLEMLDKGRSNRNLIAMPDATAKPISGWYRSLTRIGDGLYMIDEYDDDGCSIIKASPDGVKKLLTGGIRIDTDGEYPDKYLLVYYCNRNDARENLMVKDGPDAGKLVFNPWRKLHEIETMDFDDNDNPVVHEPGSPISG